MKIEKFNERRNIKDYKKYTDIVTKYLKNILHIEKIIIYKESSIDIEIKTWEGLNNTHLEKIINYFGGYLYYRINPSNGAQLTLDISGIPESFFEKLDVELNMEKYNL